MHIILTHNVSDLMMTGCTKKDDERLIENMNIICHNFQLNQIHLPKNSILVKAHQTVLTLYAAQLPPYCWLQYSIRSCYYLLNAHSILFSPVIFIGGRETQQIEIHHSSFLMFYSYYLYMVSPWEEARQFMPKAIKDELKLIISCKLIWV